MNIRNSFFLILLFLSTTQMEAQVDKNVVLVEQVVKSPAPNDVTIPYTKYKLSNGLTLIVHEDHSDPIVHVDVTYHVGSAREEIGISGFAHFFEHMMFQGSKNVGDEEHFKVVTEAGGTMNGTTNRDRTNYFETVPKNYLETALWLEADRMGFLLEAVTQKKFEIQRATVKNEKSQRYENRPYGMISETVAKNLYPYAHAYSWPTIGFVEDLDRVNVEDLKKFFLRWYGPNNAVLTIGGDVSTPEVVALVEKYFGIIPRGPEVEQPKEEYFKLDKDRYISMEDNVRFPLLYVTYPTVPNFHQDEAALDILAEIMGQGKSSILYQNLVKTKKAVQAGTSHPCTELAGEFNFTILAYPGTKLSDIEEDMRAAIIEFAKRGVTPEDLEKAKAKREAEAVYALESVSGKVSQLAMYETFLGEANYIRRDVTRYANVTKNDVMRVFETYIKSQHPLILSVVPKGQGELIASKDNYTPKADPSKVKHFNYDTLKMRSVVKDNIRRDKRPKVGASPVVTVPPFQKHQLGNGMNIIISRNEEVPDFYMQVNVKAGQLNQPKGKEGVAYLLSRMLQESTQRMTAEEISNELDKLGTRLNVYVDEEDITIAVRALKKNFMQSISLVNEIVLGPKFDPEEFERVKKQQLEMLANMSVQGDAMADETFSQLLYGKEHPLGTNLYGTLASVQNITVKDVQEYFNTWFTGANTNIVISGDFDEEMFMHMRGMMEGWRPSSGQINTQDLNKTPAIEKTKIYLVNKDNAPQSEIRVGYRAMPYDATGDFYKANIMNYPLGGAFNSRINLNLREDKGYTYGARSYFSAGHYPGTFRVSTAVRADVTDSALVEIMKELTEYRKDGISKDELNFTQKSILERDALKYETNSQKAGFIGRILAYNLDKDVTLQQASVLKKLKRKEVNALAQQYLPIDKMVIVISGDANMLRPKLARLGYEVVDFKPFESSQK